MDDDEKVRRNLVVASFAVVLFFWLELPEGAIVKRVFGEGFQSTVSPLKVWGTTLAVLAYQLHRYLAALPEMPGYKDAVERFRRHRRGAIQRWISGAVAGKRGLESGSVMRWGEATKSNMGQPWNGAVKCDVDWPTASLYGISAHENGDWFGTAILLDKNDEEPVRSPQMEYEVLLPHRWRFDFKALLRMWRSPQLSEIAIPIVISYAAIAMSANALSKAIGWP